MKLRLSLVSAALMVGLAGCKTDRATALIATLSAVSSASSVAIAVASSLEMDGQIPEDTARQIIAYAQAVSDACAQSVATLNAGGSSRDQALEILSAVVRVQAPVAAVYGNAKAHAVVAALEAALAALKVQLQNAGQDVKPSHAKMTIDSRQEAELRRAGYQAEIAAATAAGWLKQHPALAAAR